jgi:hypothetical protein
MVFGKNEADGYNPKYHRISFFRGQGSSERSSEIAPEISVRAGTVSRPDTQNCDPKTVILLFALGKVVCISAKTETDVYKAVKNLQATLEQKGLMTYA